MEEKGVSNETAENIGSLVKTRGPPLEVLLELRKEGSKFMENEGSVVALNELEILFKALEKANALDRISFDLSLARGLDYYTGVIYEAVFKGVTQVWNLHSHLRLTCYLCSHFVVCLQSYFYILGIVLYCQCFLLITI